jgi:hypothetical protein
VVKTVSTVEIFVVELIPVGIPLPLSSIVIEPSLLSVIFIVSALPEITSSTELSNTSHIK